MNPIDRRGFIGVSALAGSAAMAAPQGAPSPTPEPEVTRILARYAVNARFENVPPAVRKEAARTLLNWLGCAIGGSQDETVSRAFSALSPFFGPAQATIWGRRQKADILHAALLNGISSHVFDFDDTHLATAIHPAGPVLSAILGLAETQSVSGIVSGTDMLNAMIAGIEVECRLGEAVYPAHYDIGWHITGTAGVFGAAAAAGKLLGLSEQQMIWALSLAATQPVGLREMFGSMTKSFHPGRAAQNGLTAALLASKNFTSSDRGIEAKSGWANVVSTRHRYGKLEKFGKEYLLSANSYKPFACGVVVHPIIDGCTQLRNENKLTAGQIDKIDLKVHPLVLELTGKKAPHTGLEGKFSVYHAAAVAIVAGAGGEAEFSDRAVLDPVTAELRTKVSTTIDPSLAQDQTRITITLKDGRKLEKYVEHAVGSVQNPMSDRDLEVKFHSLTEGVLRPEQSKRLMELCWNMADEKDARELSRAAAVLI